MPPSDDLDFDLSRYLVSIRRHLHMHPEVGLREHKTHAYVRDVLQRHGLMVQGPVAGTGLFVDIEGVRPGPMIGYRADLDALPIQDAKDVGYRSSRSGAAHLCGHDAHTTIAIGVALILDSRRDDLEGTVRVFFQPNEESFPSGGLLMIEDGVLDGVEAVYAVHVDPTLDVGRFGLISGPATAAADRFIVDVSAGSTGHSARPHEAIDTMWTAVQIASAYYQLAGRVTDARNASVLTICRFDGGEAYNVIPAKVSFGGTVRSTSSNDRALLHLKMRESARHIAALTGADVTVHFDQGVPAVVNDDRMLRNVAEVIEDVHGGSAIHRIPLPSMGGEDFAHYLQLVPGALVRVGTRSGPSTAYPLHDARFDIEESALAPAADLMARVLTRHLAKNVTGQTRPS